MTEPNQLQPTKLIVLAAFDRDDEGELRPAFEAREMRDEDQAKRQARMLKDQHTGVIAWSRSADLVNGIFGEPEILAQYGEVPDME
jgi:hypothetical protein